MARRWHGPTRAPRPCLFPDGLQRARMPSGLRAIAPGAMMVADPLPDIAVPTLWIGIGNLIFGMLQVPVASRLRRLR